MKKELPTRVRREINAIAQKGINRERRLAQQQESALEEMRARQKRIDLLDMPEISVEHSLSKKNRIVSKRNSASDWKNKKCSARKDKSQNKQTIRDPRRYARIFLLIASQEHLLYFMQ